LLLSGHWQFFHPLFDALQLPFSTVPFFSRPTRIMGWIDPIHQAQAGRPPVMVNFPPALAALCTPVRITHANALVISVCVAYDEDVRGPGVVYSKPMLTHGNSQPATLSDLVVRMVALQKARIVTLDRMYSPEDNRALRTLLYSARPAEGRACALALLDWFGSIPSFNKPIDHVQRLLCRHTSVLHELPLEYHSDEERSVVERRARGCEMAMLNERFYWLTEMLIEHGVSTALPLSEQRDAFAHPVPLDCLKLHSRVTDNGDPSLADERGYKEERMAAELATAWLTLPAIDQQVFTPESVAFLRASSDDVVQCVLLPRYRLCILPAVLPFCPEPGQPCFGCSAFSPTALLSIATRALDCPNHGSFKARSAHRGCELGQFLQMAVAVSLLDSVVPLQAEQHTASWLLKFQLRSLLGRGIRPRGALCPRCVCALAAETVRRVR